jgi:bacterioferritin-associated ferredoxin
MIYNRNCPNCNSEIQYKNPKSFKWAERGGKECKSCRDVKMKETMAGMNCGKPRRKASEIIKAHFRDCTECNNPIGYSTKKLLKQAISNNTICNSCNNYKHNRTWNDIINQEHINEGRRNSAEYLIILNV